jgi:Concanavalin A-like lectin/glucanases superfamily
MKYLMPFLMLLMGLIALPALAQEHKVPTPLPHDSYSAVVLADKPLGYWRLGEGKGPTAHDESGHKRDGTYVEPVFFKQPGAILGDLNSSIKLEAKGYVEVGKSHGFSPADAKNKGMTVEVWMKPDKLVFHGGQNGKDYTHWLGKGETGSQEWALRFYPQNSKEGRPLRISAYIFNPEGGLGAGAYLEDDKNPPTTKAWMHIVATFDDPKTPKARVQIYKNGVASPHNSSTGNLYKTFNVKPVQGKAPLRLGTQDLESYLIGYLDEVAIYGHVLTPAQILRHYEAGIRK